MIKVNSRVQYMSFNINDKVGALGLWHNGRRLFASSELRCILEHHWFKGAARELPANPGYVGIENPTAEQVGLALQLLGSMDEYGI